MTEYRTETVFTWGAPPLKFGVGALDEIGFDCAQLGLERVLIVTDEGVAATGIPARAAESMQSAGLKPTVFSGAHVEPTDESFRAAAEFAGAYGWDGGFGSTWLVSPADDLVVVVLAQRSCGGPDAVPAVHADLQEAAFAALADRH